MQLERLTGLQIGDLVRKKALKAEEIIDYFESRNEKRNDSINAFVYFNWQHARDQAKIIDNKIAIGSNVGPLAGVPVCLKDFLPSKKGWENSHGGVPVLTEKDDQDSEFCMAAEKLGAIVIGKTNAPAFAFRGLTDNQLFGPTSTPFNVDYNSGGSSGGTAAAVGDGMVPIGQGTDGGGSIRIPASWCNCFGFKASAGIVPSVVRPDAWTATHPFCCDGPISRSVGDAATIMNSMSHYDYRDPYSIPIASSFDFVEAMRSGIKGMKIAFTPNFGIYPIDDEVYKAINNAANVFRHEGAIVDEVDFPLSLSPEEICETWFWSISIDTALDIVRWKNEGIDLCNDPEISKYLSEEFIKWNKEAANVDIFSFQKFNKVRTEIYDAHIKVLKDYNIIIGPTTLCPPPKNSYIDVWSDDDFHDLTQGPEYIGGRRVDPAIGFGCTMLENFIGFPAATVPAGFTHNGLPIGLQIIGPRYGDLRVFAASGSYERAGVPWWNYEAAFNRIK